jgi:hypothetical protein
MEQRRQNSRLTADFAQTPKCVYFAEKVHKVLQITTNFIAAYTTLTHNKSFTKYYSHIKKRLLTKARENTITCVTIDGAWIGYWI